MDAKVVQDARAFLRAFRTVLAFAESIDQAGTLEEDMVNARAEHARLFKEIHDQKASLSALQQDAVRVADEMVAEKAAVRKEVKRMKDQAEVAAAATEKRVAAECEVLVTRAKHDAQAWDARVLAARDELDKTKAELAEVEKQLASTKKTLEELFKGLKDDGDV